jgi:hypothetical protein
MRRTFFITFYWLVVIILLIPAGRLCAQTSIVQSYHAESSSGKVYLRWTIQAGYTCNGIVINRSADQIRYSKVGEIFGVCGSTDSAQTYTFTDDNPIASKTNFYKLELGFLGQTAERSVFVWSGDGVLLYPNPAGSTTRLQYDNTTSSTADLYLYDMQGRLVATQSNKQSVMQVDVSMLPGGLYLFRLLAGGTEHHGKLCVVH